MDGWMDGQDMGMLSTDADTRHWRGEVRMRAGGVKHRTGEVEVNKINVLGVFGLDRFELRSPLSRTLVF